jgi:hypothetical protein
VPRSHRYLEDAYAVSYAYRLSTEDGDSELSEWTPWHPIERIPQTTPPPTSSVVAPINPNDPVRLPVIRLDDFGYRLMTKRTIYHRKKVRGQDGDGKPLDELVVQDESEPAMAFIVEAHGPYDFVDERRQQAGGKKPVKA